MEKKKKESELPLQNSETREVDKDENVELSGAEKMLEIEDDDGDEQK